MALLSLRAKFYPSRGTGASCIYPLLGCSQRPKWRFAVTGTSRLLESGPSGSTDPDIDIDDKNITYAKRNALQNDLKFRIRPLQTKPNDPLIPLDAFGLER